MAGLGYRAWTPGEIITANNVQYYLQDKSVQVFTNSSARAKLIAGQPLTEEEASVLVI